MIINTGSLDLDNLLFLPESSQSWDLSSTTILYYYYIILLGTIILFFLLLLLLLLLYYYIIYTIPQLYNIFNSINSLQTLNVDLSYFLFIVSTLIETELF